jgi:hypothetical protein
MGRPPFLGVEKSPRKISGLDAPPLEDCPNSGTIDPRAFYFLNDNLNGDGQ